MLRPWSQQARHLTPRRGTVAHLGNRGRLCSHSHGESIAQVWCPLPPRRRPVPWAGEPSRQQGTDTARGLRILPVLHQDRAYGLRASPRRARPHQPV